MKIKDLPLHMRPREKLVSQGAENLKDSELLAILLRTGKSGKSAIEISEQILKKVTKKRFLQMTYSDIVSYPGIDSSKACSILAGVEFTKRALDLNDSMLPVITSTQDVVFLLTELINLKKEHFVALYLNARNEVILKETITVGLVNISVVHPREVFEPAIRSLAVQIIVAHNHPSGDVTPSFADIETTDKLVAAGEILGIEILDHIIIGKNKYLSFKEEGKI